MSRENGIERTLGKIEAGIEFIKESHLENRKDINEIKDKLISGEGKISVLKEKCEEFEENFKLEKHQRIINSNFRKEIKTKIAVYGSVIGSVIGVITWIGGKFLGKFFGGN